MPNVALKHEKNIISMFPDLKDNIERSQYIKDVTIKCINVYKKTKKIEIILVSDKLIPPSVIYSLKNNFKRIFCVPEVLVKFSYSCEFTLQNVLEQYWKDLLFVLSCHAITAKALLNNATYRLDSNKLEVNLANKTSEILTRKKCDIQLQNMLSEYFGKQTRVVFLDYIPTMMDKENYIKQKEKQEYKLVTDTILENAYGDNATVVKKEEPKPKSKYIRQRRANSDIYGKIFDDPTVKIVDITQDSGDIALNGEVFRVETRELQNEKILYMFDVTDYTSSITCKMFVKKEDIDNIKGNVKEGAVLKVRGTAQYDKYIRDTSVFVTDIIQGIEKKQRMDNSPEKRVELHLHTQMSTMDGVSSPSALIKRAKDWGHKAIAITDHGVLHSSPGNVAWE